LNPVTLVDFILACPVCGMTEPQRGPEFVLTLALAAIPLVVGGVLGLWVYRESRR
jgi:hypothetical protein